jgi:hypothetical protein
MMLHQQPFFADPMTWKSPSGAGSPDGNRLFSTTLH